MVYVMFLLEITRYSDTEVYSFLYLLNTTSFPSALPFRVSWCAEFNRLRAFRLIVIYLFNCAEDMKSKVGIPFSTMS